MKIKKVLKIIGVVILSLIILFLIHSFRNFIIICNLQDKAAQYENSTNYNIHSVSYQNNNQTITLDYYAKDNKQAMFLERNNNGEITRLSFYNNGERIDMFVESPSEKIVQIDTKTEILPVVVVNALQTDNKWQTFLYGSIARIRKIDYNGKDCYTIDNYLSPYYLYDYDGTTSRYIIDRETGLLMEDKINNVIDERRYEFNNVEDTIFVEPDISQYKLKEDK